MKPIALVRFSSKLKRHAKGMSRHKLRARWFAFLGTLYPSKRVKSGKLPLVICCVFRNEAPFIREWIDFHLMMGVERFYLIDNFSDDDSLQVLEPYIKRGVVIISTTRKEGIAKGAQSRELNRGLKKIKSREGGHCWVAIVDVDEFLFSITEHSIQEILQKFEGKRAAAVLVNWLMFGTSGIRKLEEGQPMIHQLKRRAPEDHKDNIIFKPIVYTANVYGFYTGPHLPFRRGGTEYYYSDETVFNPDKWEFKHSPLRINHYWFKSEDYFFNEKLVKRKAFGFSRSSKEKEDAHILKCNKVEDTEIVKAVKRVERKKVNQILE